MTFAALVVLAALVLHDARLDRRMVNNGHQNTSTFHQGLTNSDLSFVLQKKDVCEFFGRSSLHLTEVEANHISLLEDVLLGPVFHHGVHGQLPTQNVQKNKIPYINNHAEYWLRHLGTAPPLP